ncbi:hypothetical protein, partial [Flectobacillus sp. BAB-3569]|uniref:hypothetical protein n=1 Tax=Flectobacillus sp. BAB-3569 TaxID=1509483 RepID=UPI001C3E3836
VYKAAHNEIYSDVLITIYPDGSYEFRYWFDEERIIKEEYDDAMLSSKDFPHAMAKALVSTTLRRLTLKEVRKYNHDI